MRLIVGDPYQGRTRYAKRAYGEDIKIYYGLYDYIQNALKSGLSEEIIIEALDKEIVDVDVIIAEEGFHGLTPIDKNERRFTELYGRSLQVLAGKAESVERVVCGLSLALK